MSSSSLMSLEPDRTASAGVQFIEQRLLTLWTQSVREKLERQWLRCAAYTIGLQHETWETIFGQSLVDEAVLKVVAKRLRGSLITNKIKPMVNRRQAQLVSAPAGWEVIPNSPDFTDRQAALLASDALNHYYYDADVYAKALWLAWWSVVTGDAFARPSWHPNLGQPTEVFFDPVRPDQPLAAELIPPQIQDALRSNGYSRMVPTGDVELKLFSPLQIFYPYYIQDPRRRPWYIEQEVVHYDELADLYDETELRHVPMGIAGMAASQWFTYYLKAFGLLGPHAGFQVVDRDDEAVLVRRLFYRRCRRFPEGRMIVDANRTCLYDGPNPYLEIGIECPYVSFRYQAPGQAGHGTGLVEDLVTPQKALNDIRTARVDNIRLMGRPVWLNPAESGCERITNAPGQVLRYRHGRAPQPIKIDPIDMAGEQLNQTLIQDMQDLGFQQDVTSAKVPPNLRSGVAISLLQERDDAATTPIIRAWDKSFADLGQKILTLIARFWPDRKVLHLYGSDQANDVRYFRKGVIQDNVRVIIPIEPRAPKNRTLELQKIFESLQLGLLDPTDPLVRMEALRTMELGGGWERLYRLQNMNYRRAMAENEIFAELGPQGPGWPQAESWEDHAVHLAAHNELRLSDRWEAMDSEARLMLDAHAQMHTQFMQRDQERALQMMELARGGPGQKGRPSPPARPEGGP